MKRKLISISLIIALLLIIFMPGTVAAKKTPELIATGMVNDITPGVIQAAGDSGRWLVKDRDIDIDFDTGDVLEGGYTLTYHTNVDTDWENLQVGSLQGVLVSDNGDTSLNVKGTIDPTEQQSDIFSLTIGVDPYGNPIEIEVALYVVHIEGGWTFIGGGQGHGTFDGNIYVLICKDDKDYGIPLIGYDLDGHVISIYPGIASTILLYD